MRRGVGRAMADPVEIGVMRRRALGPVGQKGLLELPGVVVDGNGVDVYAIDHIAILRQAFARRVNGNARDETVLCVRKIRHAGSAVVDDEMSAVFVLETAERRQAGVT